MKGVVSCLTVLFCAAALTVSGATQWWDVSTNNNLTPGTGVWSTVDSYWAPNATPGTNAPGVWTNGNDAIFAAGTSTAIVNTVTANSVSITSGFVVFKPGTGAITINGGGLTNNNAAGTALYAPVALGANQLWNDAKGITVTGQITGASATLTFYAVATTAGLTFTNNDNNSFGGLSVLGGYYNLAPQYPVRAWPTGSSTILGGGALTLNNAIVRLDSYGAQNTTVTIGNVTNQGRATLVLNNGNASYNATLAANNFVRNGQAQLVLVPGNSLANKERFTMSGSMATLTNGLIAPWVVRGLNAASQDPTNFLTYGANGVTDATYTVGLGNGSTQVAILTNVTTTLSGPAQCYVFRMTNGTARTLDLHGQPLTVGDQSSLGAIMFVNAGDLITDSLGGGSLNSSNGELLVYTGPQAAAINVPITGSGGLTKLGGGTLSITNSMLCGGNVTINGGDLIFYPTADLVFSNNITEASGYGTANAGMQVNGNGAIAGGNGGSFCKDGPRTLTLTGTNNLTGGDYGLLIRGGGTVCVSNNGVLAVRTINGCSGTGNTLRVVGTNAVFDLGTVRGSNPYYYGWYTAIGGAECVSNLLVIDAAVATNQPGSGAQLFVSAGAGSGNGIVMTNGARVYCAALNNGSTGSNNWVLISGSSTLCTNTGAITVNGPNNDSITVNNGATLTGSGIALNNANVGGNSSSFMKVDNANLLLTGSISIGYSATIGVNSYLIITNGATVTNTSGSDPVVFGASGDYMVVAGTNAAGVPSVLDLGAPGTGHLQIGSGVTGCWVRVDAGGIITNMNYRPYVGSGAGASYNSLIITNGGRVYGAPGGGGGGHSLCIGGVEGSSAGGGGYSNSVIVSGPGSLFDFSLGNPGNSTGCILLPAAFGTNGSLVINNGGMVKLSGNTAGSSGLQVGSCHGGNETRIADAPGSTATGNTVTISTGGTLDLIGMIATNLATGNYITNYGGVYQFPGTPVILSAGGGIYLNNGWISFRGIANADVKGNWANVLANIVFSGTNAFRLNNSTNNFGAAGAQSYWFDAGAGFGATNYAGLEMMNGGTAYTNGSVTIGTNGWLTFSNTTAVIWGAVTNFGKMRITDSTVTFRTNLTLQNNFVLNWSTNATTNAITVLGRLSMPANGTINTAGALAGNPASLVLFTQPNGWLDGSAPSGWTVDSARYAVKIVGNTVALVQSAKGTAIFLR